MCIPGLFGGGKQASITPPSPVPIPSPAPLPTISPSQSAIQDNQTVVRNRLRYGLASTIRNQGGAQGILNPPQNSGLKTTLG